MLGILTLPGDIDLRKINYYMSAEKRYERKMSELSEIRDFVGNFITKSLSLNIYDNLSVLPNSKTELDNRKIKIHELYSMIEDNYNRLFSSGVFFNYLDEENLDVISDKELSFYSKRKAFVETYREQYRLLHDYLNFYLNKLDVLYTVNDLYVWEIKEKTLTSEQHYDNVFDESKPHTMYMGKMRNIKIDPNGIPFADEVMFYTDYLNHINERVLEATKEEHGYLKKVNNLVQTLRLNLVEYIVATEDFELAVLNGDIEPKNNVSVEIQLQKFMLEKTKIQNRE